MSRPFTPTEVLAARGSRHANRTDPPKPSGRPQMPPHLTVPARDIWSHVLACLDDMNVSSGVDGYILGAFCQTWADYVSNREKLKHEPWMQFNAAGTRVQNPRVKLNNELLDRLVKLSGKLGLSPVDRAALARKDPPKKPGRKPKGTGRFFEDKETG